MSISQPSQYQCDNMQFGDVVYVKQRNFLYRLYRSLFGKNKNRILVRTDWVKPKPDYNEYYQEDCTLIYNYELKCVQTLKSQVPYIVGYGSIGNVSTGVLQSVDVGLYNIILQFKKFRITIPTDMIDNAIKKNELLLKTIEDSRLIMERLKFEKYKGSTFQKIVQQRNITQWIPCYCTVCGKPIIFIFDKDYVSLQNNCECGNITLNKQKFSYDEFAVWFSGQTDKNLMKKYKQFWFDSEE